MNLSESQLLESVFAGGGEMGARMRAFDWSTTDLGPVEQWPQSLRACVRIVLGAAHPMLISWGPDYTMLYNDAYGVVVGTKHPAALGRSCRDVFAEAWGFIGPRFDTVFMEGQPISTLTHQMFTVHRNNYLEECYFAFSYSPVPDDDGNIGGVLTNALDMTERVIAVGLASARAYEQERERAEALAEIDRAKTAFFSNVSHEFRTPLTLMLGPLEEVLRDARERLGPDRHQQLVTVRRNGLRLLKLVNTLLDVSRIEAGRAQAVYEPTDLARVTAEIASVFRSAMENAGLTFSVECESIPEAVYVDRDMWEKVVSNLLSNAFKFTFEGVVTVTLKSADGMVELQVGDTGVGIPDDQRERVFERFHRIEGTPARTYEGTGIGLALVEELVSLHGGRVRVDSTVGRGSTFTVAIPLGTAHLPAERIRAARSLASTGIGADVYAEEAQRWLRDEGGTVDGTMRSTPQALRADSPESAPASTRELLVVADDNADMRQYLEHLLGGLYEVHAVADGSQALEATRHLRPALVLADVMMPRLDGFGLLRAIRNDSALASMPVILLSARAGEESRVEGLKAGADDYLVKPFTARELLARVDAHLTMANLRRETAEREERLRMDAELERRKLHASEELLAETGRLDQELQEREAEIRELRDRLYRDNLALRDEVDRTSMFEEIVGSSDALKIVLSRISKVAPTDSTVLIAGETGTGKELIARAVHKRSQRSGRGFVSVNCAALAPSLISSELFGHERGAFTGATQRRLGRFELADGGTIFLDEVGELLPETQVALLRVLQEREFERVGGAKAITVDVRVIAATNRDLRAAVANGTFRQDLFYRLNVFPIEMPPLRERKEDILLLVEYFVKRYATRAGKNIRSIDRKTLCLLRAYDWPGNIRELQNVIERSVILSSTDVFAIDESWLPRQALGAPPRTAAPASSRRQPRSELETIEAALAECRGRVAGPSGAAAKLGVPPSTLDNRIRALNIDKVRFKFR